MPLGGTGGTLVGCDWLALGPVLGWVPRYPSSFSDCADITHTCFLVHQVCWGHLSASRLLVAFDSAFIPVSTLLFLRPAGQPVTRSGRPPRGPKRGPRKTPVGWRVVAPVHGLSRPWRPVSGRVGVWPPHLSPWCPLSPAGGDPVVATCLPCCPGADGWGRPLVSRHGHVGWWAGLGSTPATASSLRPGRCPCAAHQDPSASGHEGRHGAPGAEAHLQ